MTSVFLVEVILKVIAWGFILNGANSYLYSYWNALDFIIVLFSVIFLPFL